MAYEDTDAEKWNKYFKLEGDVVRRELRGEIPQTFQFERSIYNMKKAYERVYGDNEDKEGDGWIDWNDYNWRG